MREEDGWAIFRAGSIPIARDWFLEYGLPMIVVPRFTRSSGHGSGHGYGKRPLSLEAIEMNECVSGRNYLLFVGDGFAYVGRFARPAGPFGAVLEGVVNVCRTGGVPWDELARGDRRSQATYRRFDGLGIFPMVVGAFEWAGDLPTAN